jgi:hypothetical protein
MLRRVKALAALLVGLALASAPARAAEPEPVARVDRMRVVGAPPLDARSPEGLYVWVEDRAIQFAAVGRADAPRTFSVRVDAPEGLATELLGDFTVSSRSGAGLVMVARVEGVPARGALRTRGELAVSAAAAGGAPVPLFVGPLALRAAPTLRLVRQ